MVENKAELGPRNTDQLKPFELAMCLSVPGWRIWQRSIFESQEYGEAAELAESKPLALCFAVDGKGHQDIWDKYMEVTGREIPIIFRDSATFDRPSFVLEPLTIEEVRIIDENGEAPGPLGSVDKPNEILRPNDLKRILGV